MTISREKLTQVVQKVSPQSRLLRAWPLKGGLSAQMIALEIEEANGQTKKLIMRHLGIAHNDTKPHPLATEFSTLQLIHARGLPTPRPYLFDESGEILTAPYLLLEYAAGAMDFAPTNLENYLYQFATQLAHIHGMNLPQTTLNHLPVQNGCAEMQKKRPSAASTLLAESKIQETLAMQWPLSQHNNATLLHGDYWPGNTLWQDGLLTAVIDWEDAQVGDPLLDLAISRLDVSWIFGMDALHIFSQHYQSLRQINYVNLSLWDLCAALRFIRIFGGNLAEAAAYFGGYGRADITEQTMLANYNAFIRQAFEGL